MGTANRLTPPPKSARRTLTSWPTRGSALPMPTLLAEPAPPPAMAYLPESTQPAAVYSIPCSPVEKQSLPRKRKHWEIYFGPRGIVPIWSANGTSVLIILIRRKTSGQTNRYPVDPLTRGLILFSVFIPPPDPIRCAGSKTIVSPKSQPSPLLFQNSISRAKV